MVVPRGRITGGARKRRARLSRRKAALLFLEASRRRQQHFMRTIAYVDGFNLYYGVLRNTPYKWLDLHALFQEQLLGIGSQLIKTRYYTASIKASSSDDPASPQRQQRYLRALKAHSGERIEIQQG